MSVIVEISAPLRAYTDQAPAVELEGKTAGEVLAALAERHPDLRRHVFRDDGGIRSFVNVFVGDADIRHGEGAETKLTGGETITIVPSIAGGTIAPELDAEEIARYSRHLIIPEVGMAGQKKLKAASVLVVGTGGLGSPLGLYLAAAGVGRIGLVDFDVVEYSNLQRQIIHGTRDVGRKKLDSAKERMADVNPFVRVDTYETALSAENALEILAPYDVVIDGTDNFPTRYLVNDACVLLGKPNVYGSIFRFEGQASVFDARTGPCYRCLYPEPPPPGLVPSCAEGGVLGVLPGIVGTIQANEGIKLLLGVGEPLIGRLLLFDALAMRFRELKLAKDPSCPICSDNPTIDALVDYEAFCGLTPAAAEEQVPREITPAELHARLEGGDRPFLLDVRNPAEWDICRIDGATLIPLPDLPARVSELDRGREIVCYCRMGTRSAKAVRFLAGSGFAKITNLAGGITRWASDVDPSMPRY